MSQEYEDTRATGFTKARNEPEPSFAVYALMWESVNVAPHSPPKLVGWAYSESEAEDWVSQSPSLFVRRYYVRQMMASQATANQNWWESVK